MYLLFIRPVWPPFAVDQGIVLPVLQFIAAEAGMQKKAVAGRLFLQEGFGNGAGTQCVQTTGSPSLHDSVPEPDLGNIAMKGNEVARMGKRAHLPQMDSQGSAPVFLCNSSQIERFVYAESPVEHPITSAKTDSSMSAYLSRVFLQIPGVEKRRVPGQYPFRRLRQPGDRALKI